ncbi:helix-turn-helix domain-containing protein [Salmonella enterica]|uniref:helix-turn-helix domain-containing protein n=1 Tax=Salmonella enterica TaxID=28901 RepID=UPI0008FF0461|nr:helix-turn-helix transcriptional regulator [Salmonella enterica]AUM43104.1 DNA-binding protein [Salmonella enterica subsp. enterica serovar Poona str. ATCC BAA-1673]
MHPSDIKAELEKRGTNLSRLSREHRMKSRTLGNVLRTKWPKAEMIVANAIGLKPEEIWPSRYEQN